MTRHAYHRYKSCGLTWLGEVPAEWKVERLRFHLRTNPPKSEVSLPGSTPVSFVPMEAVGEFGGLRLDETRPLADVDTGYTYFRDGDVVVAKITPCFENGKGAIAVGLENGVGFGTTELHVLRPGPDMERRYLFYLTMSHAFRNIGKSYMYGASGQKRVPEDFVRNLKHPIPTLHEQRAIAGFLDQETRRIDQLIAKKERQIDLLEEKRAAIITHAVTNGLNPNAKMKNSGITWLGEIPAHWKKAKFKWYCISIRDGTHNPPPRAAGIHRLLSVRNIIEGEFVLRDDDRTMTAEDFAELLRSYSVEENDIVLAIVGATTGKSAVVHKMQYVTVQRSLAILRPQHNRMRSEYLNFWIRSNQLQSQIKAIVDKYSAQPGIYLEDVGDLGIPIPPIEEQDAILQHLTGQSDKIRVLVNKISTGIQVLNEYRAALITSAVTGKVDVRGEVA